MPRTCWQHSWQHPTATIDSLTATPKEVAVAKPATVHRLELVPPPRGGRRRKEQTRQVVDVTLRTSDRMLLTVAEAAERLGIGRSTMYVLIADGQIDTVRVGRLRRIEPEALTAYISRMRTRPMDNPRPA